jgi:predicted O-methyltransferase YrrM
MDNVLAAIVRELHRFGAEHDATKSDRLERLRNVEPDTAQVLAVLVRATRARRVLEIGTSNGYSTLWLADAVASTGGRVLSVDVEAARTEMAASNLERAGLRELVELRVQDAALTLAEAADRSVDMVFLDAERPAYAGYWPQLLRVLVPGGLLCVDNVRSHEAEVSELRSLVRAERGVQEALVPTGAGLLIAVTAPDASVRVPRTER